MKLLGAIIAGGQSTRFGEDKAAVRVKGRALIEHVADALQRQTDHLVVCGRHWPGLETVVDWPEPGLGPLGGFCGALRHAEAAGFDAVLTAGCDVLPIPESLAARLGTGPAYVGGQYLLGLWPATLATALESHLKASANRSIQAWISRCGATKIPFAEDFFNLNTRGDLTAFDHL